MRQSDSSPASSTSTLWFRWIERPLAALWQFIVDFWLLWLFAILLGLLVICVPQSRELWRYYILSFPPPATHAVPALIHALVVVAAFLFSGFVFAKAAHRKVLQRDARGDVRRNTSWVLPFAALLPLVLTLAGAAYAAWEYMDAGEVGPQMLTALAVSGGLLVVAVLIAAARANASGAALARMFAAGRSFNRMVALAALALLIIFLALPLLPAPDFVGAAQLMGALPAFLFSLALVMYGIDAAFGPPGIRRWIAQAGLIIAALGVLFGDITDAHHVRTVPVTRTNPFPDVGNEFLRWLEAREDKDQYDRYPVFIVAAQGGGLFSAYHTARVLANLQDQCPTFAQHVFAISGVSGGSLGAAVFAGAVKSISPGQKSQPCREKRDGGEFLKYTDRFLNRDFLAPLAFLSIVPNIAQRVLALPPDNLMALLPVEAQAFLQGRVIGRYDRALGLEYGFERAWHAAEPSPGKRPNFFEGASVPAWSGKDAVPALILNAARADTGITYSVAPFRLDTQEHLDFRAKVLAVEAPNVDVPISTAVGLSARYPFLAAPGMIEVASRRWFKEPPDPTQTIGLVDGGFVENSGLATVDKLLREIHNAVVSQKGSARRVAIHVIAIQDLSAFTYSHSGVENGSFVPEDLSDLVEAKDLDEPSSLGVVEFTAPLTALNASRSARSFYTLNSLVETVETLRCAQGISNSCAPSQPSRSGQLIEVHPVAQALFGLTANNRPLPLAWQLSNLSWERIAKRAWANEHASWTCGDEQERLKMMIDKKNIAELRGLGEDLGGFVDRWAYACGRDHVRKVLKETKH